MDRGVRLLLAATVLLSGIGAAMMNRRPASSPSARAPAAAVPTVLRQWTGPQVLQDALASQTPETEEAPFGGRPRATILSPLAPSDPPKLAKAYPRRESLPMSLEASEGDYLLPSLDASRPAVRIHKIIDGDTLATLAERYLGNAQRQGEIFEANQDVLSDPNVLPIGVELRIPPRRAVGDPSPPTPSERPLVPVVSP